MKCSTCGYDYLSKLTGCTRCGYKAARTTQKPSQTKLLEFPAKQRMSEKPEQSKPTVPAWRAELQERVREIRARKEGLTPPSATAPQTPATTTAMLAATTVPTPATTLRAARRNERESPDNVTTARFPARPSASESETATFNGGGRVEPPRANRASANPLVQAALSRVQRASENARRSSLPRIEPSRGSAAVQALALDHAEATARALEPPIIELDVQPAQAPRPATRDLPRERRVTQPLYTPEAAPVAKPAPVTASLLSAAATRLEPVKVEPVNSQTAVSTARHPQMPAISHQEAVLDSHAEAVKQLDEDHCLDYLEAEVERVDRELHQSHALADEVSYATHWVINLLDLGVIAVSCAPFLAIIKGIDGSFAEASTQQAAVIICLLVSAFYLGLTQLLGNRTFGMMATGTHVASAAHLEKPAPTALLMRTAGYLLSFAVVLAGFFWIAVDAERRSWHDRISGTLIVRDE